MKNIISNGLFTQDLTKFQKLVQDVTQFNSLYNGNNIIQDDIFSILTNYARKNQRQLELFRFPTKDDDFCALTCVQKGIIFVYVNSWLPLAKQIFAAAHELYHIHRFIEEDKSVLQEGFLLNASVLEEETGSREECEANAFAGILLVPSNTLHEQMQIYGVSREKQELMDIVKLMAIFSVPYKAMLLRLFEEGYMDYDTACGFLNIKLEVLKKMICNNPDADRWQRCTPDIVQMGSLKQLMTGNQGYDLLTDTRIKSDQEIFENILKNHEITRR